MRSEDRIRYLSSLDLFHHFSEEDLYEFFAENVEELKVPAGEVLCREGSPGDDMYILLAGELKITKETKFITTIKPVEYIGEMALIEAKPRSATVLAEKDSTLLRITRDQFQEYFSNQPKSLFSMMKTLSHRIRINTEIIAAELEKANILIHDMKNQMAPFLFLDMIDGKLEDESAKRMINVMQRGRDNLTDMMAEALANAKRLHRPRNIETGYLTEVIEEIMEAEVKTHPDLSDRIINFELNHDTPQLGFCRLEIRRVLVNLILNAAQASQDGDQIEVGLDGKDQGVIVYVKDRGVGVPEEDRQKIFESHYTTREEGNGLGLASCRQIIEDFHKGKLSFDDREGGGTVFHFTLPLQAPAAE
jgi:signal transduction histidine kinase